MRRLRKSDWQVMLSSPSTHWMAVALAVGCLAGLLALLPVSAVFPEAPPTAYAFVWLVVAGCVAVPVAIRLEKFVNGKEAEDK